MEQGSTIAAIATPLGVGGIAVVRVSGAQALSVADAVITLGKKKGVSELKGYTCAYGHAVDQTEVIDEVVVTVFRAPHSYTGEDVVEIATHGGVYLAGRVLRTCCEHGARLAQAGEFTRRAFLNGKLDLTQAEAVIDLISAQGKRAAQAALTARDGALFERAQQITAELTAEAAHLAAWIDYPEEEIVEVDQAALEKKLRGCQLELQTLLDSYDAGRVIREGIDVAIVGRPNAGKSTLMNLLAGYQRSIVAEIPGTTRDVVSDTVMVGDMVLHLADTAGIRFSEDPVERAGVALAVERIKRAQLVLAVFDGSTELDENDLKVMEQCQDAVCIALVNKNDLPQRVELDQLYAHFQDVLLISAKENKGAELLEQKLTELFRLERFDGSTAMVANERQRAGIFAAHREVGEAADAVKAGVSYDAVCVCIERAIDAMLELTGKRASQEVVDQVFSRFCVGK